MIPFCTSFENGIHLSKLNHHWNVSSRYILFLMCFVTVLVSTIILAYFLASLSWTLCIGLFFWLKWDGQPFSEDCQFFSLGLSVEVWISVSRLVRSCHLVLPVFDLAVSFASVTNKTRMWALPSSSPMVLFACQPTGKLQSKEWLWVSGAVGRRVLDVCRAWLGTAPAWGHSAASLSSSSGGSPIISYYRKGAGGLLLLGRFFLRPLKVEGFGTMWAEFTGSVLHGCSIWGYLQLVKSKGVGYAFVACSF